MKNELERFREYRDAYLSELPENILQPGDPNYHLYKCRTSVFGGISLRISQLINKDIIPDDDRLQSFFDFINFRHQQTERGDTPRTTPKEIEIINNAIGIVIKLLELTPKN